MLDAYTPSTAREDSKDKEPAVEPKQIEKQEVEEKEEDDALDNWEDSEVAGNEDEESAENRPVEKIDGKYRYEATRIFSSTNVLRARSIVWAT